MNNPVRSQHSSREDRMTVSKNFQSSCHNVIFTEGPSPTLTRFPETPREILVDIPNTPNHPTPTFVPLLPTPPTPKPRT